MSDQRLDDTCLIRTEGLSKRFGGVLAVNDVSLCVRRGSIHALIGPNGAGKSTLVSLLSGRLQADAGRVLFEQKDISALNVAARMRLGMGYTFQITRIFPSLDPLQHVLLGLSHEPNVRDRRQRAQAQLGTFGLDVFMNRPAGELSHGHQRLLELAMVTVSSPRFLMLDEPTQGLSDGEIAQFLLHVRQQAERSTLLLIEHNMAVVMALADAITVLDHGAVIASGTPESIRADPAVQVAYLGSPAHAAH